MTRWFWCALTVMGVAAACGGKKDEPKKTAPAAKTKPAPTTPPATVVDAAAKRVSGPTRASIDCATLLTSADIKAVCATTVRSFKATPAEKVGRNCNRAGGPFNARVMVMLTIGTGDVGHPAKPATTGQRKLGNATWNTVTVRKKPFTLQLTATNHDGQKPRCSPAQLQQLATRLTSRLP